MLLYEKETEILIGCFYKVHNTLGFGFLEKVYENALAHELSKHFDVKVQHPIAVYYEDIPVGHYYADILINNSILVELKAVENLVLEHTGQLLNYMKATNVKVGFLLNFGKSAKFKRLAL